MTGQRSTRRFPTLVGPTLAVAAAFSLAYAVDPALAQQSSPAIDKPSATAEVEQRGQRTARDVKYGNWQKFCFKPAGTMMVCRTSISGTWETGQAAIRVDLIEREGDSAARLQIFLPVGLYLQAGVKLTVDQGNAYKLPYVWCLTNTCIAADLADPTAIREMETGRTLSLEVANSNILAITISVPLEQFAAVRQGAPTQIFDQAIQE